MGAVIASTVLHPDGTTTRVPGMLVPRNGEHGRVAFHYDYSPALLPGQAVPPPPEFQGMWRYRDLLPLDDGPIRYPLRVGDTPLVPPPGLREMLGIPHLWIKDETRSPTGSNKDRATALVLEHAMRHGVRVVSCASTGNVAVSLAVGAAAARVRAAIFVPAAVSEAKLTVMLLAGATVIRVTEGYDAAFRLSREAASAFGWYDRNTGVNPLTLEAKKTVAFEIWEQLGRRFPDIIVVPVGDGPTLSALVKGFRELQACGVTERLPRLIGVQAEGCQPLKSAWDRGGSTRPVSPDTIADGIAVGNPISALMVLRDIQETGGSFVVVSDDALMEAIRTVAAAGGIIAEPAAASTWAGLECAVASGLVDREQRIVVLVTGSGLKTPQFLRPLHTAFTVRSNLSEVQEILEGVSDLAVR